MTSDEVVDLFTTSPTLPFDDPWWSHTMARSDSRLRGLTIEGFLAKWMVLAQYDAVECFT